MNKLRKLALLLFVLSLGVSAGQQPSSAASLLAQHPTISATAGDAGEPVLPFGVNREIRPAITGDAAVQLQTDGINPQSTPATAGDTAVTPQVVGEAASQGQTVYQQVFKQLYRNMQLLADPDQADAFKAEWEHKFDGQLDTINGAQAAIEEMVNAAVNLGCPITFDGKCLYMRAFRAYLQFHYSDDDINPNLAVPSERLKWAAEWEHKFDDSGLFATEAGTESAIRQMRDSLGQRFDYVVSPEGTKEERTRQQAQFGGIGVPVGMRNGEKRVLGGALELLAHSPASASPAYGLVRYGDVIVKIDGQAVDGMTIEAAINKINGKPGSTVGITLRRSDTNGQPQLVDLEITRAHIPNPRSSITPTGDAGIGVPLEVTNLERSQLADGFEMVAGEPDANSPAKGKIIAGDLIVKIDGTPVNGLTLQQALDKVRGPVGTPVTITVSRPGEEIGVTTNIDFTLTRRVIVQHAVHFKELDNGVSYIKIDQFESANVPLDMANAIGRAVLPLAAQALSGETDPSAISLSKQLNALKAFLDRGGSLDEKTLPLVLLAGQIYDATDAGGGLVIDLRGNPGGDLEVYRAVAGMTLPHGVSLVQNERVAGTDQIITSEDLLGSNFQVNSSRPLRGSSDKTQIVESARVPLLVPSEMPLVVLADENSASASELLAGMLQANHRATIVGKPTVGKGVGQKVVQLPYGRSLHVTNFEFFPAGTKADWVGVIPNIDVTMEEKNDTQQDAAVLEIKRLIKQKEDRTAASEKSVQKHREFFDALIKDRAIEDAKPVQEQDPWKLN